MAIAQYLTLSSKILWKKIEIALSLFIYIWVGIALSVHFFKLIKVLKRYHPEQYQKQKLGLFIYFFSDMLIILSGMAFNVIEFLAFIEGEESLANILD